mmetsp:Transcript_8058/g.23036  ORF Transcript_8058/g.23036 Transcript_8058/m.23036 type:complete len:239 (+) Transcript_8058:1198-1914(+)
MHFAGSHAGGKIVPRPRVGEPGGGVFREYHQRGPARIGLLEEKDRRVDLLCLVSALGHRHPEDVEVRASEPEGRAQEGKNEGGDQQAFGCLQVGRVQGKPFWQDWHRKASGDQSWVAAHSHGTAQWRAHERPERDIHHGAKGRRELVSLHRNEETCLPVEGVLRGRSSGPVLPRGQGGLHDGLPGVLHRSVLRREHGTGPELAKLRGDRKSLRNRPTAWGKVVQRWDHPSHQQLAVRL